MSEKISLDSSEVDNELYRIACINMLVLPFSDIAVEIVEDSPFATSDNLFNEEKIFIKREWSEIRLKTYILGRCAAHRALQTLQKEIVPILKGRDGEPIWPFDIVGSISHKDAIAVAAVGKKKRYKGIGVDIEDQTTILSKKEYSLFCTPQEIACIDKKEFSPIDIFSRKEAILKAYYTAYSKLCNWIDIDTINVSKASNVTIICMLKKNFIINLCCVEK